MRVKSKKYNNYRGFTLVELMIAVIIIGILAAIGLVSYGRVTVKAKAGKAKHAISLIAEAEKMYQMSYGVYRPVGVGAVNIGIGTNATGMNISAVDNDTDFTYTVTGDAADVDINAHNTIALGTCGVGSLITLNLPTGSWTIPGCYQ